MNRAKEILAFLDAGREDEAHSLAQEDDSPMGSYLHGMLHRDEGDMSNARYWFRRAGDVPARLGIDPLNVDKDVEREALARLLEN